MRVHANGQRLDSAQHQPRIERRENRAGSVLNELELLGVVFAFQHNDTADAVAVSVQILRRAVDHDVGAQLDRTLKVRTHERVVDDQSRISGFANDSRNPANIGDRHQRIRRRFDEDHLCFRTDRGGERIEVRRIDVGEVHAKVTDDLVEETERSAVDV